MPQRRSPASAYPNSKFVSRSPGSAVEGRLRGWGSRTNGDRAEDSGAFWVEYDGSRSGQEQGVGEEKVSQAPAKTPSAR